MQKQHIGARGLRRKILKLRSDQGKAYRCRFPGEKRQAGAQDVYLARVPNSRPDGHRRNN